MGSEPEKNCMMLDVACWPTLGERVRFEICLLLIGSRFTSTKVRSSCSSKMHEMVLKKPNLLFVLVPAISRSPLVAFSGLVLLLGLPAEILKDNFLVGALVNDFTNDPDKRKEKLDLYIEAIMACFDPKIVRLPRWLRSKKRRAADEEARRRWYNELNLEYESRRKQELLEVDKK